MDFRQLQYFLAVVDNRGVSRAAEALYISQPSVSQAIRALERDLGVTLFHRASGHMVLTATGEVFLDHARDVVRGVELARAHAESAERLEQGRLVVASTPSQSIDPLADVVADFLRDYPGMQVNVDAASTVDQMFDSVRFGRAEIGIYAHHSPVSLPTSLRSCRARRDPFIILARSQKELPPARQNEDGSIVPITIDELAGSRLIVGQRGTGMRRVADLLITEGDRIQAVVQIEQREALIPLVRAGAGLATVGASWRGLAEASGLVTRTLDVPIGLEIEWIYRNAKLSPAATAFLRIALSRRENKGFPNA
ncbi:LysR family transcriptional regulator [Auritidibacter ignavus]|uniref:LysR family transcriptional regulator n=1 Tax=Auritidibacter ignavus TaxID=678932 RepID=UPI000F02B8C4|nr:LysR family transcriptional regulator [Auritidibacter ignavus]NIH71354.1 DNA-binding transcriptional LysR family regulator [Auritidibacter ignavus]RMX23477.1 LysR family transcriptional regulator [Auritidibacter ignavus]WGH83737.1 LysR family transcriptional regulator [Auritidibacter ignavus]WGH85228.1 LysR family transcriptional regulator [Auritidibacter ignavus]WGH87516.1 LysR family transcriptional regulator [Auritidibacter ignavus]